jgi:hypothetical protein
MRKTQPSLGAVAELRPASNQALVILTAQQLEELIEAKMLDVLDRFEHGKSPSPELLSGAAMALKLGISRTKMHRLREQGCPAVKVGDIFKFVPGKVMLWLEGRSDVAG